MTDLKWQKWTQIIHSSALWLLVLLVLGWLTPVTAHGSGAPRLVNVVAGPYRLWVWSLPDPIRVGETHVSVAVEAPAATPSLPEVPLAVQLAMRAVDQPGQQFTIKTSKQDRFYQTYYEADFTMPAIGQWQAVVQISGPAGVGMATFPFTVLPPQRVHWDLVIWSIGGVVAVLWVLRLNRNASANSHKTAR